MIKKNVDEQEQRIWKQKKLNSINQQTSFSNDQHKNPRHVSTYHEKKRNESSGIHLINS